MKSRQVAGEQNVATIVATAAITANRLVAIDGTHTAAAAALGPALFATDSGDNISVGVGPIEVVEAGAAITAGAAIEADSVGRATTKSSGVTVGRAIDAATAAGDLIRYARLLQ